MHIFREGFRRIIERKMSSYENVVGGKLKLKGKALDVKAGGLKKKKKSRKHYERTSEVIEKELSSGGTGEGLTDSIDEATTESKSLGDEGRAPNCDDHLTPAERRYIEQREQLDVKRLAKIADKSHRDRIEDFNHYLANMSEHYDIPKVGPG